MRDSFKIMDRVLSAPVSGLLPIRESVRKDFETVAEFPDPSKLIEVLAREPDLVAAPEPAVSKVEDLASESAIDSEVVWAALRTADWACRALVETDVDVLMKELEENGFVKPTHTAALKGLLVTSRGTFGDEFDRRAALASVMRTFRGVSCACSLRVLDETAQESANEEDADLPLIPVSIVRISGDEPEPFVFQCTAADLDRLIEAFGNARTLLSRAEQLVPQRKPA